MQWPMATSPRLPLALRRRYKRAIAGLWTDGAASGVPQIVTDQVVAFVRHAHGAGRQGLAVLVDAGAVFLGEDAEIADEIVGRGEAVDVDDFGDEDGGRGHADAGNGDDLDVRRGGQGGEGIARAAGASALRRAGCDAPGRRDRGPAFRRRRRARQATDCLGGQVDLLGQFGSEVRDLLERSEPGLGDALGGGIFVEQLQHPGGREVVGQVGQFGKDAGQEIVQAIDGLRGLFDLGLQASGDFAEQDHCGRDGRGGAGQFDDGEACHGLAFGVVGGAFGEVGLLVVLVAFGLADGQGDGQGEAAEEVFEIGGILPGGVDADVEVGLGMLLVQLLQAFLQGLIAGAVFHDGERLGGGLAIGSQEGDAMAVACGVDADADAVQWSSRRHRGFLATKEWTLVDGQQNVTCVAR